MARQAGDIRRVGTEDNLCFYKMLDEYFIRKKSSLTGKKFWKNKCFEASRKSCSRFGKGNVLASSVYQHFQKQKELWFSLKKAAIAGIKEGKVEQDILVNLFDIGFSFQPPKTRRKKQHNKKIKVNRRKCLTTYVSKAESPFKEVSDFIDW